MKLLIPTRNRPASLASVLGFLEAFYPDTQVIVADGSRDNMKSQVEDVTKQFNNLSVDFRSYHEDIGYFDRVLDVLEAETDDYIVMGADDDYPFIGNLKPGEDFLREHPDYAIAVGRMVIVNYHADGEMSAMLELMMPVENDTAEARVKRFGSWPYPLSYCVCRRDVLINRYKKSKVCVTPGEFDLFAGVLDCLKGKILAIPEVGVVMTRHSNETYLRRGSKLEYLEIAPQVLSIVREMASEIEKETDLDADAAMELASLLFGRHIGQFMTGSPKQFHPRFLRYGLLSSKFFVDQYDFADRLFQPGTSEYLEHRDRMLYISKALRDSAEASL